MLLAGLALALGNTCTRPALDELEFVEVSMKSAAVSGLDSVKITAAISGLTVSQASACGFIYAPDANVVLNADPSAIQLPVAPPPSNGEYSAQIALRAGQQLFFRAYVQLNGRTVYSPNLEPAGIGDLVAMAGVAQIENDEAVVFGLLSGLNGIQVTGHGHVYSRTDSVPAIGKPGCLSVNKGMTNDDYLFADTLRDLEFNTRYQVRAFLITGGNDTVYSKSSQTIQTAGGWKRVAADFPQALQEGVGIGAESVGKAFVGFGCPKSNLICLQNDLSRDFTQFAPPDAWSAAADFPGLLRTNVSAFNIGDTIYVLFGEYFDNIMPGTKPIIAKDFRKYNVKTGKWSDEIIQADIPPRRTAAISFVANGKGYLGAGRIVQGLGTDTEVNDFWEYNPGNGSWRQVASLPLRTSAIDPTVYDQGRQEAAAFAIDGYGYAGGGQSGVLGLTDFWRFTPPSGNDMGIWEFAGFFPGPPRVEAVAFSAGATGYYGTGYNAFIGELDDCWTFTPGSGWSAAQAFRGGPRRQAFGFALQGKGYLGGGLNKKIINNGNDVEDILHADCWVYTPKQ